MRAITGAVVSSKPCSLRGAARGLLKFYENAASDLPSSDCATYLRTVIEAVADLRRFRRDLSGGGAASLDPHGSDGPVEGEAELHGRVGDEGGERDGNVGAVLAGRSRHSARAEAELAIGVAGEKKSKKKKIKKEEDHEDIAVAGIASLGLASPEIAREKRKKKEKHSSKDHVASHVKQEVDFVADGEMGSEKKKDKKKKEQYHVKLEEDVMDVEEKIVSDGVAGQVIASGEKKRKKKKHGEEEDNVKSLEKGKLVVDGDLGSEKKRKKKRGRVDDDDNGLEQVDHTKKKQRKQS
ncbi:hypothetical protein ACP70R_031302 [Stipagrostis hirtigluma subsp. patula]